MRNTGPDPPAVGRLDVCERAGWGSVCAWGCNHPCPVSPVGMDASAGRSASSFDGEGTNFLLYKHTTMMPDAPASAPSSMAEECTVDSPETPGHGSQGEGSDTPAAQGGLPLPEVVMQLVKDPTVLQWDASQRCYIVIDGERFEHRFNQMRKVCILAAQRSSEPRGTWTAAGASVLRAARPVSRLAAELCFLCKHSEPIPRVHTVDASGIVQRRAHCAGQRRAGLAVLQQRCN